MKIDISEHLVYQLLKSQFPYLSHLTIKQILPGGWDNRSFLLGNSYVARFPSNIEYALSIEKEYNCLPYLAKYLSLPIPVPIRKGNPEFEYPFHWTIYQYIPGEIITRHNIENKILFAQDLANFLKSLRNIVIPKDLIPEKDSFSRGCHLSVYHDQTVKAMELMKNELDMALVSNIWEKAVKNQWTREPVWVHGDISSDNLLTTNGRLSAVIDFGSMAVGDPACDFVMGWTYFNSTERQAFRKNLEIDDFTWSRAKGWALWKALICASKLVDCPEQYILNSRAVIKEIIQDEFKS